SLLACGCRGRQGRTRPRPLASGCSAFIVAARRHRFACIKHDADYQIVCPVASRAARFVRMACNSAGTTRRMESGTDGLEHDPEKLAPDYDPGWEPVFGKDHAPA